MADLRFSAVIGAALFGVWHLGFRAGQQSTRDRSNIEQMRDVMAVYKLLGYDKTASQKMMRAALPAQQRKASW